jgi:two-component system sensor histidine kinase KdpD
VSRGRHKIFLGMAAGVGKTVRMLQEGHAAAEAGRDVAVGILETHGRADTARAAVGLEVLARRRVDHRGTVVEEMDLPGILRRAPELCLVDELAHTNAPGLEHAKRWEDVCTILEAGIDVFSTVNVQHIDSLNDRVTELSGVVVRETVPDRIVGESDEIVLIDLTPEALVERLRAGKVYPEDRVDAALNNFFKIETLAALREFSLRQVAEEVEAKRVVGATVPARRDHAGHATHEVPQVVGERLLALAEPVPSAQRLVRRAWRSAQRLGAELDVLWVQPPGRAPTEEQESRLAALRTLCSVLGAQLLIEAGDDVATVVTEVAQRRGTTYVLLGASRPPRGLARLNEPLALRIVRRLPGVDVRIVADRALRREVEHP